jgi:signal transduction histidine kinase
LARTLNLRLKEAGQEVESIRKAKSAFMIMISHELRTPLTAIKEGIGIVLDGSAGPVNAGQKKFLQIVDRNVTRLEHLVNQTHSFMQLQARTFQLQKSIHNLNQVIRDVARSRKNLIENKGLYLKTQLDERLSEFPFDAHLIRRVIDHLLDNAIDCTKKGGVTILSGRDMRKKAAVVRIRDTGKGLKKKDLSHLFQCFAQIDQDKYHKPRSAGISLAICKEIIEIHGGTIWANSLNGKGSEFIFKLPLES